MADEKFVERAYAPHCDPSILHAPEECEHCDKYPDWQEYRKRARIAFTNQEDSPNSPCPSLWFRPAGVRDLWGGNQARPEFRITVNNPDGIDVQAAVERELRRVQFADGEETKTSWWRWKK